MITAQRENQLSLPIEGMTCASCVAHVEGALKRVPGVSAVSVNLTAEKATLEVQPERFLLPGSRSSGSRFRLQGPHEPHYLFY
jgi:copper chaperone CopZ